MAYGIPLSINTTRYKRPGRPIGINQLAPRALAQCYTFSDASFSELLTGTHPVNTGVTLSNSPYGRGAYFNTNDGINLSYQWNSQTAAGISSQNISIELVFYNTASSSGALWGLANASAPTSGGTANYYSVGGSGGTTVDCYYNDGASSITSSGTVNDPEWVHFTFVSSSGSQVLYLNGQNTGTGSVAYPYTNPGGSVYSIFGCSAYTIYGSFGGVMLLANIALTAWTAAEVAQRYNAPFNFLSYMGDNTPAVVTVPAAVTGAWLT
jgi:hypothetical protein